MRNMSEIVVSIALPILMVLGLYGHKIKNDFKRRKI